MTESARFDSHFSRPQAERADAGSADSRRMFSPGIRRSLAVTRTVVLLAGWLCQMAAAQTHEWTWMGGSEYANQAGTYGTLGVFAKSNIPGARDGAVSWTDHQGNVWLFGGSGTGAVQVGYLNDLWELKPSSGEWAWMGGSTKAGQEGVYGTRGVASASNAPGARYGAAGGTDLNGNLWLFGGSNGLNDLWEFNPSTKEWTWVSGSNLEEQPGSYGQKGVPATGNVPGGRSVAVLWFDLGGNIWLFGGNGEDSSGLTGSLNDLWEFNLSTKQWTWISGDNSANQPGVYGQLRIPAASNVPGARSGATGWVDLEGNLWLFGGSEGSSAQSYGELNDLWEFNSATREWAWMSGSTTVPCLADQPCGKAGVYGKLGVPGAANAPGGRDSAIGWTDRSGSFWLFGGNGFDSTGTDYYDILGELNDLWVFSPTTNEWTWMAGSSTLGEVWSGLYAEAGVYGTLAVSSPNNVPGSRASAANWVDESGNLWLLGGEGFDSTAFHSPLNDLWRYSLPATAVPCATPVISPSSGRYPAPLKVTIGDSTNGAVIYYTLDGSAPSTSSLPYNGSITIEANTTVRAIAVAVDYSNSAPASAKFTIEPFVATPEFSLPAGGIYGAGQLMTISDATAGAEIFFTIDGSTPTTHSVRYISPFLINATMTIKAIAVAPGHSNSEIHSAFYRIVPSPSVLSDPATSISANGATLNAIANDWGWAGSSWFLYGTSASALTLSTAKVAFPAATSAQPFSAVVENLQNSTVYYFEPVVSSVGGMSYGRVLTFTTPGDCGCE